MSAERADIHASCAEFVAREVAPLADRCDREERIPPELIGRIGASGFLGCAIPETFGGGGADPLTLGAIHETFGGASASVEGLLNVHNMATQPILRWGTADQKARWLPRLAGGELLAAFAITEPHVGSDVKQVATRAVRRNGEYRLSGRKTWITCGQVAGAFLLLAQTDEGPTAFLVERGTPGLSTRGIGGMLGCRGYMLADVLLDDCPVPADQMIGRPGFGFPHVMTTGLDAGRYALAWACVGMGQACLDACRQYTNERVQFGERLRDHALIQRMMAEMLVNVTAARLLCADAGARRARRDPDATMSAAMAKYFASRMLGKVANDALQIHGANGCSSDYPLQRWLRDARIMEIIEGTTQVLELMIAKQACQPAGR